MRARCPKPEAHRAARLLCAGSVGVGGARTRGLGVLLAVLAHGLAYGALRAVPAEAARSPKPAEPKIAELFAIDLTPPEPPSTAAPEPEPIPPLPTPEPPAPRAPRADTPPPRRSVQPPPAAPQTEETPPKVEAPAPEAAAAAEVVTAAGDGLRTNALATSDAAAYAGGSTAATGTRSRAVRSANTRANGVPDGSADQSRPAALLGGLRWDCLLPGEAEDEGIVHATVKLRLKLGASGQVESAEVMLDPGYGFGREALRCARQKRFSPALDRNGNPTAVTQLVNVNF